MQGPVNFIPTYHSKLNERQTLKLKDHYLKPFVHIVWKNLDCVQEKDLKYGVLFDLMQLVIRDRALLEPATIDLTICDQEIDRQLCKEIDEILKNFSCDRVSINHIYQALYVILHQYRLNKSPDPILIDVKNQEALGFNNTWDYVYTDTKQGIHKLSFGLKTDGPEPSDFTLEQAVINAIPVVLSEHFLTLLEEDALLSPVAVSEDEQIKDDERLARELAREEKDEFPQVGEKRKYPFALDSEKDLSEDRALAFSLAARQFHPANSPRLGVTLTPGYQSYTTTTTTTTTTSMPIEQVKKKKKTALSVKANPLFNRCTIS